MQIIEAILYKEVGKCNKEFVIRYKMVTKSTARIIIIIASQCEIARKVKIIKTLSQ